MGEAALTTVAIVVAGMIALYAALVLALLAVGRRQLLQEVWGPQYETETNYLRVYMAQLRRKLEPEPSHPRHLLTEPGLGYRFEVA